MSTSIKYFFVFNIFFTGNAIGASSVKELAREELQQCTTDSKNLLAQLVERTNESIPAVERDYDLPTNEQQLEKFLKDFVSYNPVTRNLDSYHMAQMYQGYTDDVLDPCPIFNSLHVYRAMVGAIEEQSKTVTDRSKIYQLLISHIKQQLLTQTQPHLIQTRVFYSVLENLSSVSEFKKFSKSISKNLLLVESLQMDLKKTVNEIKKKNKISIEKNLENASPEIVKTIWPKELSSAYLAKSKLIQDLSLFPENI